MADGHSNVIVWCDICQLKGDEKSASFWCFECDQFFCKECEMQHRYSKALKDHIAISMDHYDVLPEYIRSLKSHCTEHDKLFEFLCADNNEPMCVMCTSGSHRSCSSQTPIRQIVSACTQKELLSEHYSNIDELCKFIFRLQQERENSLSNFKHQIQGCAKQMKKVRKEMNDRFDDLEANILSSLQNSFKLYSEESQKFMEDLLKDKRKTLDIKNDADMLVTHASPFHTLLSRSEFQTLIKECETSVQTHLNRFPLKGIDSHAMVPLDAKSLLKDLDLEKRMKTVAIPSAVEYVGGNCSHAQLSSSICVSSDISMSFRGRFECNIVGCSIRDSGEYVFCDYSKNKRILIFRPDGSFERIIKTKGRPACLVFVDNIKLAVTFPDENEVKIIEYSSGCVTAETKFETRCCGIGISKDNIVVGGVKKLYKLDSHGDLLQIISLKNLLITGIFHLECNANHIIIGFGSKICWLDNNSSILRNYDLSKATTNIQGITTDSNNNIYFSCLENNCIIVTSQNGDLQKVLVNKDDGLLKPTGLCFDRKKNQILTVTNSTQCAIVYNIKR